MNAAELRELSSKQLKAKALGCQCKPLQWPSWESLPDERWPAGMERVGTLREADIDEPTFEEFHLNGTRLRLARCAGRRVLGSARSIGATSTAAAVCSLGIYLRYTEYGGYYIDHRVRLVDPNLVV